MELVLDVLIHIASFNRKAWYKLTLINEEFDKYARTGDGVNKYVLLFTKTKLQYGWTGAHYIIKLCGSIHSINDAPAVFNRHGLKCWYINNKLDRNNDLPSVIQDGSIEWYKNGLQHRDDDKPAFIGAYGEHKWYKNGIEYTPNK